VAGVFDQELRIYARGETTDVDLDDNPLKR